MITKKNILNHELIGLEVMIKKTKMQGIVVDETKNSLVIQTVSGAVKRIIKEGNDFNFRLKEGSVRVCGEAINSRPWDRLKKVVKVKNRWQKILE